MDHPFQSPQVKAAFAAFPEPARTDLRHLRALIFEVAATLPIGPLSESLKWGQPSYTTAKSTPIRLALTKDSDIAILTHCQSTVISDFRAIAPPDMRFDGNRALLLDAGTMLEPAAITPLITTMIADR
jgi:hypothetical protein